MDHFRLSASFWPHYEPQKNEGECFPRMLCSQKNSSRGNHMRNQWAWSFALSLLSALCCCCCHLSVQPGFIQCKYMSREAPSQTLSCTYWSPSDTQGLLLPRASVNTTPLCRDALTYILICTSKSYAFSETQFKLPSFRKPSPNALFPSPNTGNVSLEHSISSLFYEFYLSFKQR